MMPRMVDDAEAPIACWVCDRTLSADEPRWLLPIVPDGPSMPPVMSGVACLSCYRARDQTYVPGAAEGRLTSRVLRILALEFAS